MFRRLFACLALVTGLAALGAPASAALSEVVSERVTASAPSAQTGGDAACPCSKVRGPRAARCEAQGKKAPSQPVVIYLPTVQFGADRALE